MRLSFLIAILLTTIPLLSKAQIHAITDEGKEVLLKDDGTWKYAEINEAYETRLDTVVCQKDKNATFLVKGKKVKYGVWINPKKWKFSENTSDKNPSEYIFSLKEEDAGALIVPERAHMSTNAVANFFVKHLQSETGDAQLTREEIRKVNGIIMKHLEVNCTVQGIKLIYFGYFYSGNIGSIQFMAFATPDLYEKYKKEMETLLNGFTILE